LENRRKAEILLDYVSTERRWFTSNDNPDRYKSAKMIINDMVLGNLVWAELPPRNTGEYIMSLMIMRMHMRVEVIQWISIMIKVMNYTKMNYVLKVKFNKHSLENLIF